VLSQHSVVSLGVIADVGVVIVVRVLINVSETAYVLMRVGAHVDMALWTEVTTMVTTLTATMGANTVVETSGGTVTGSAVSPKNGRKSMGTGGGDVSDVRTRMRSDSFVQRSAMRVGDRDGEWGETVDTAMSPLTTMVAGTMEVGPDVVVGQTTDRGRGIGRTGTGVKG